MKKATKKTANPVEKKATKKATKKSTSKVKFSPKDLATSKGEPWVSVLSVELDANNIGNGAFELDWNEIFVAKLVKAGYKGKNDIQIVDQWFQDVCRNVVIETYEQEQADPDRRTVVRKDLGDGRSEVS